MRSKGGEGEDCEKRERAGLTINARGKKKFLPTGGVLAEKTNFTALKTEESWRRRRPGLRRAIEEGKAFSGSQE